MKSRQAIADGPSPCCLIALAWLRWGWLPARERQRAPPPPAQLDRIIASSHRSDANRARDKYRHPRETLLFFGIRPDQTVVEILPIGAWYTEIIAPLVRANTGSTSPPCRRSRRATRTARTAARRTWTCWRAHPGTWTA